MIKNRFLNKNDFNELKDLFIKEKNNLNYYKKIGWTESGIFSQLIKKNNHSIGLFTFSRLIGFIIGDLYTIDKFLEYEILLLYICKKYRKKGYASDLLNLITGTHYKSSLNQVTLEVSENNIEAINLYKKNKFIEVGKRNKYYYIGNNTRENALIFKKNINKINDNQ